MEKYKNYSIKNVGEEVSLNGWVSRVRNLGGLVFIDLRNRMGIMQVVVRPENEAIKGMIVTIAHMVKVVEE